MVSSARDALYLLVARLHGALLGERGQTLGEYSLIVGVIGVGTVVISVVVYRNELRVGYDSMSNCLTGGCGGGP